MSTEPMSTKSSSDEFHVMEIRVDKTESLQRAVRHLSPFSKLLAGVNTQPEAERPQLYYKPYFFTSCLLSKRFRVASFEEREIEFSVGGLTGVASVYQERPDWSATTQSALPPEAAVIAPKLSFDEAVEKTTRRATHVQVRQKYNVSLHSDPILVFKLIWLITLHGKRGSKRLAADAVSGYVLQE